MNKNKAINGGRVSATKQVTIKTIYAMSKETKEAKNASAKDSVNKEKLKALQLTIEKLEKTYGKGAIMKMGDAPAENVEVIPTGSLGVDIALGIGGLQKGRVIDIYGPESSGKTT